MWPFSSKFFFDCGHNNSAQTSNSLFSSPPFSPVGPSIWDEITNNRSTIISRGLSCLCSYDGCYAEISFRRGGEGNLLSPFVGWAFCYSLSSLRRLGLPGVNFQGVMGVSLGWFTVSLVMIGVKSRP